MKSEKSEVEPVAAHRPRKRKTLNNLALSLGRMTHVKTKTLASMKSLHKVCNSDCVVAVSIDKIQLRHHLRHHSHLISTTVPAVARARAPHLNPINSLTLQSPLETWMPLLPHNVNHTCSFCGETVSDGLFSVHFNFMLPAPFVICCTSCLGNESVPAAR